MLASRAAIPAVSAAEQSAIDRITIAETSTRFPVTAQPPGSGLSFRTLSTTRGGPESSGIQPRVSAARNANRGPANATQNVIECPAQD